MEGGEDLVVIVVLTVFAGIYLFKKMMNQSGSSGCSGCSGCDKSESDNCSSQNKEPDSDDEN